MPWTANDAEKHTHKATTTELKELWARIANERLEKTGDEGRAIREANSVIARQEGARYAPDRPSLSLTKDRAGSSAMAPVAEGKRSARSRTRY